MTTEKVQQRLYEKPLRYVLAGASIALGLISLFLSGVNEPKPEWGALWMLRPLIIVPLAGGGGGFLFFCLTNNQAGWKKLLGVSLGIILFMVVLWLGIVLGLDGTLWN